MSFRSEFRPGLFDGQTVIITGGGSGIGRCTAHELAALGAHVALVGRSAAKLVLAARGRIDGLVHNAGGQYKAPLKGISTKGFEAVVRTNLTGGFLFMREVFTRWMENHGGAIVNMIADIWNGWPNFSHSGAARGGMLTLTESAASEWAAHGVRVNTVAPGAIASSGLDTYDEAHRSYIQNEVAPRVPLKRFGTESEVSAAIVFLLSPAASFITGTCLRIDGGAPNAREIWGALPALVRSTPAYHGLDGAELPAILAEKEKP